MYAPFFGLEQAPFSIAPDPRYLFMSERHREALAHLVYGLDAGGGFVLLTGGIGTGKTTVCRCFLEQVPKHCNVAYIFNPRLTVPELVRSICQEFRIPVTTGSVKDCIDRLNFFLLAEHAAGRNNALIIDEAQNLAADVLEQLRLLTNLETSERKLLQIILIGQPELRTLIARPSMEQLAQRVIARYHLEAMKTSEIRHYVAHRLAVAGWRGPLPFTRAALQRIYPLSGGVPRRINLLCDRALLGAYAAGAREVNEKMLRQAAREVFDAQPLIAEQTRARATLVWTLAGGTLAGAVAVMAMAAVFPQWARLANGWWQEQTLRTLPAPLPAPAETAAADVNISAAAAVHETTPVDLADFLAGQSAEATLPLWHALADLWQAQEALPPGIPPCVTLPARGLRCWQSSSADVPLLRQLNRPALLTLTMQEKTHVVLLRQWQASDKAAEDAHVTLQGQDGSTLQMPLAQLTPLWPGEITTLWQMPPGMLPQDGDAAARPSTALWVDQQLSRAGVADTASRRARIVQFQMNQGLTPDGMAGPLTLMLLNRASGVTEPMLHAP